MNLDHDTEMAVTAAVALVNTRDVVADVDDLTGPDVLRTVLTAGGFAYQIPVDDDAVAQARALRERLRPVFDAPEDRAVAVLNDIVQASRVRPRLVRHDGAPWHFHYAEDTSSWGDVLGADLGIGLLVVIRDFSADRLGVCAAEACGNAFVDLSRNGSKRYCDPRTCGNRAAVRAYRARQAEEATG